MLLARRTDRGTPLSKFSVHTYIRPVRLMLNWAQREGEQVTRPAPAPPAEKPIRDVLSREEIDRLEHAMPTERDKLIIRVFGDCGLRLEELSRLRATDLIRSRARPTSASTGSATACGRSRSRRRWSAGSTASSRAGRRTGRRTTSSWPSAGAGAASTRR